MLLVCVTSLYQRKVHTGKTVPVQSTALSRPKVSKVVQFHRNHFSSVCEPYDGTTRIETFWTETLFVKWIRKSETSFSFSFNDDQFICSASAVCWLRGYKHNGTMHLNYKFFACDCFVSLAQEINIFLCFCLELGVEHQASPNGVLTRSTKRMHAGK